MRISYKYGAVSVLCVIVAAARKETRLVVPGANEANRQKPPIAVRHNVKNCIFQKIYAGKE